MNNTPYFFEIKDVMTQFVAAFNDVIIKRHDKQRNVRSKVKVRYLYAPKQRVIHDLTNKARHITLPVVAVNIAGISRDESRVFNKIYGSFLMEHERNRNVERIDGQTTNTYNIPQPVPVNITVNMSILARYQTDIEQIISNFVPYNDPYIVISWKLPKEFYPKDTEIRSEVLWSGDLNLDYPDNISSNDPFRLSCDTSFTIKTWLFKQHDEPTKTVYKITTKMSPVSDITSKTVNILPYYEDITERSFDETIGPPLTAAPHITNVDQFGPTRTVQGYNFLTTTQVFVSSNNVNMLSGSEVKILEGEDISTFYPAFTGVPIQYTVLNDNILTINLPDVEQDEDVDLIILNEGGYSTSVTSIHEGSTIKIKGTNN